MHTIWCQPGSGPEPRWPVPPHNTSGRKQNEPHTHPKPQTKNHFCQKSSMAEPRAHKAPGGVVTADPAPNQKPRSSQPQLKGGAPRQEDPHHVGFCILVSDRSPHRLACLGHGQPASIVVAPPAVVTPARTTIVPAEKENMQAGGVGRAQRQKEGTSRGSTV